MTTPHQPSDEPSHAEFSPPLASGKCWRRGEHLIMERDATLPLRCVLSGGPADGYHEWLLHTTTEMICVSVPLSEAVRRSNFLRGIGATVVVVGSIVLLVAWQFIDQIAPGTSPAIRDVVLPGIGFAMAILGVVWGVYFVPSIKLENAYGTKVVVSGVHPDFLAELPEWPREEE